MSLTGAINIAKSALAVSQAQIQVTSNNIANAGSTDYTRQRSSTGPLRERTIRPGIHIGTGVELTGITREIDAALESRIRSSLSAQAGSEMNQQWLSRIESLYNELGDEDLSTQMSKFFNAWSSLANKPQDLALRQVVLQTGTSVTKWFGDLRTGLDSLQTDINRQLGSAVVDADSLAQQVADLNAQIVSAEGGLGGQANGLRDQRDAVLKKMSEIMDIKTVDGDRGMINVFVGSQPLVFNADNYGLTLKEESINGEKVTTVNFKASGGPLSLTGGKMGALLSARDGAIAQTITRTDKLASSLVFELNKIHSSGQGLVGYAAVDAGNTVLDPTAALNTPEAGLPFKPTNGSFILNVRQKSTGLVTSTLVKVDLDGVGTDTNLNDIVTALNGAGLNASVAGGRLKIKSPSDTVEFSFAQDSSGALAALGVNSFFTGKDASDIAVNKDLLAKPALLAASSSGDAGDNRTALAIAALESRPVDSLDGATLKESYQADVNYIAAQSSGAAVAAEAALGITDTLLAQREALSGVSLDEEAVNLMRQQRAFQASAKLLSTVDELMQTILNIAR